jgi:phage tail-like protein
MSGHHRAYTTGRFALEIDGNAAGWIYSCEGGNRVTEVVTEKLSQEHHVRKHIAGLKYEDITITCGIAMSRHFWHVMKKSFQDEFRRFNGSIHVCDYNNKVMRTLEFHGAIVTEIGFPGLDASSKDAAKVSFKMAVEWTRTLPGKGHVNIPHHPLGHGQQKAWSPANFRLRIDDLEHACTKINKIEALVMKQKVTDNNVGEMHHATREPAAMEFPNLVITTAESHAKEIYKWEKKFIIEGNCTDDDEKTGTLEFLTPDLRTTLFTIDFFHLGLFKVTPDKLDALSEGIRRVKAEMYVEDMKFDYNSDFVWGGA